MFGRRYFGRRHFGGRYFGRNAVDEPPTPIARLTLANVRRRVRTLASAADRVRVLGSPRRRSQA